MNRNCLCLEVLHWLFKFAFPNFSYFFYLLFSIFRFKQISKLMLRLAVLLHLIFSSLFLSIPISILIFFFISGFSFFSNSSLPPSHSLHLSLSISRTLSQPFFPHSLYFCLLSCPSLSLSFSLSHHKISPFHVIFITYLYNIVEYITTKLSQTVSLGAWNSLQTP